MIPIEASAADADAIAEVHELSRNAAYSLFLPSQLVAPLTREERVALWRQRLSNTSATESRTLIIRAQGKLQAFGSCGLQRAEELPFEGEIYSLYVRPGEQRKGYGRRLLHALAAALARDGHRSISLWTFAANHPARRFYEAVGGSVAAERLPRRDGHEAVEVAYGWADLRPSRS